MLHAMQLKIPPRHAEETLPDGEMELIFENCFIM